MTYDSNGNATITRNRAVTGQTVQADQVNVPFDDVQSMLSQVVLRSGVAPMTGVLNMNGSKITNLQDASNPGDAVSLSYLKSFIPSIIESGSNANGYYVRYADGTQICIRRYTHSLVVNTGIGNLFFGFTYSWTLPAAFVSNTYTLTGMAAAGGRLSFLKPPDFPESASATGVWSVVAGDGSPSASNFMIHQEAKGRWF